MGDCLLLTSPVRALKEEFPQFRISVLVEERFAPCFEGNPDFHQVLPARSKSATGSHLFTRHFNAIINLHGGPTSLVYSCAAWGRRIGSTQYQYSKLYNGIVPASDPGAHTVESTFEMFRWLGLRAEKPPSLRYEVQAESARRMREKFKGRPYVVIHPGAAMATKRWDAARFAAVGRMLVDQQMTVALTCGPGEEAYAGQVAQEIPKSSIMLGLSIPELAELIRGARLYIGNDTGPMHLAAAVGTPTVAIWGSSDSRRWHPWDVEHRVIQNPFECRPCPGYRCLVADSPLCIESVTADQVNEAVNELLGVKAC
jgi:ADP-heptose:LPS heptosyltransferase